MIAALLLAQAQVAVPHYSEIPRPSNAEIRQCRLAYDLLENYISRINGFVWRHDVDRGGYLTWNQGNAIRYEVRSAASPYLERIRYIGWEGRGAECRRVSREGQQAVYQVADRYF